MDFLEQMEFASDSGKQVPKHTLIHNLLLSNGEYSAFETALIRQAKIAKERSNKSWLADVAKQALDLDFQTEEWISTHLAPVRRPKRKPSAAPTGPSRDIRRDIDPSIPTISTNAADVREAKTDEPAPDSDDEEMLQFLRDFRVVDEVADSPVKVTKDVLRLDASREEPMDVDVMPTTRSYSPIRFPASDVEQKKVEPVARCDERPSKTTGERYQKPTPLVHSKPSDKPHASRSSQKKEHSSKPKRPTSTQATAKPDSRQPARRRSPRIAKRQRQASLSPDTRHRPLDKRHKESSAKDRAPTVQTTKPKETRRVEEAEGKLKIVSCPTLPKPSKRAIRCHKLQAKLRNLGDGNQCIIPGCHQGSRQEGFGGVRDQLPEIFDEALPLTEDLTKRRLSALKLIAGWMLGGCSTLHNLAVYVDSTELLKPEMNEEVTPSLVAAVTALCLEGSTRVPGQFTLRPLSCPAMLFHWRAMCILVARLEPRYRCSLLAQFRLRPASEPLDDSTRGPQSEPRQEKQGDREPIPPAFDSHFHLDRTRTAARRLDASFADICRLITPAPGYKVQVIGATANFCDPDTYPTRTELISLHGQGLKVTVGLHPKKAALLSSAEGNLDQLLKMPQVSGVGEIGLDFTTPMEQWSAQYVTFDRCLQKVQPHHVVVIHCRGAARTGDSAYFSALASMRAVLPRNQPIHLHCFSGSLCVVESFLSSFPYTFFGFTRAVDGFDEQALNGLRRVPQYRFLLETDAPYFTFREIHPSKAYSTPGLLGMVAKTVATRLETNWKDVLKFATQNALQLYK